MAEKLNRTQNIIVAGVGGQGAITLAQLVLGAAWRSGYYCMQSEVHGMSQRGGGVSAQIVFDSEPVTSPLAMEGTVDVLISMEPLEALRYLHLMKKDGVVISSKTPIINMAAYPEKDSVFNALDKVSNLTMVDTDAHSKELKNKHAGNIVLLGMASHYLPITIDLWKRIFQERFGAKGEKMVEKNIEAFEVGRSIR